MSSRTPAPALLRRARVAGGVLLIGAVAAATYGFSNPVEVTVDGEVQTLRTYAGSVGDVLDQLEVEVGPADLVVPDPDAPVESGMTIDVTRAITVEVHVDNGVARRVTAPVSSVAGVLREADMDGMLLGDVRIRPDVQSTIEHGDVVRVSVATPVTIAVDGDEHELATFGGDVEAALFDAGVEVGPDDIVAPAEDSALVGPTAITIQRVEITEVTEEVRIEREEQRREDSSLTRGSTRVQQEGRHGLRIDTYEVTTIDGEEVERDLIDQEVVTEPQPRIVVVGTKAPAPASTGGSSAGGGVWDRLARCESGGRWNLNTGNGYYGGLQFHPQTWRSVGGSGLPHQHSREEQIRRAQILQQRAGWGQWPSCSRQLGLR
jgi:resuscitation-promoting factor RpfB